MSKHAALALAASLGSLSACNPQSCIKWMKPNTDYHIELIEYVPFNADESAGPRLDTTDRSCGEDLDLRTGDVITFSNGRELVGESSCRVYQFEAEIDGVVFSDDSRVPTEGSSPVAFAAGAARIEDACMGHDTISLGRVSSLYWKQASSDYMVVREFSGDCATDHPSPCWDIWYARVTDASGHVLTKDHPPSP